VLIVSNLQNKKDKTMPYLYLDFQMPKCQFWENLVCLANMKLSVINVWSPIFQQKTNKLYLHIFLLNVYISYLYGLQYNNVLLVLRLVIN